MIASAVGGLQYLIRDGETGFLVPVRDPEALAERIRQILTDPNLRDTLAQAAANRAVQYDWALVTDQVIDVFERAARGTPAAQRISQQHAKRRGLRPRPLSPVLCRGGKSAAVCVRDVRNDRRDIGITSRYLADYFVVGDGLALVIQHIVEPVVQITAVDPPVQVVLEQYVELNGFVRGNQFLVDDPHRSILEQVRADFRVAFGEEPVGRHECSPQCDTTSNYG
ncbi:MAG: glycosyltransferase [Chloroflexi bacterium]|nr:glycosyltransferase [Chloroflexota bacterium]